VIGSRKIVFAGCARLDYEIRLFGSRLDDSSRGGDVDRSRLKRRLRSELEEILDPPVDLVIQERFLPLKLVSEIARREDIPLQGGDVSRFLDPQAFPSPADVSQCRQRREIPLCCPGRPAFRYGDDGR